MSSYARERAFDRISGAAGRGLDLVGFWEEATGALGRAVPHHLTPCWFTLDPASLLATSHFDHGMIPELPPEWLANEYRDEDVHKLADVARSPSGISTLHDVCGGDPSRSRRWNDYIWPYGGDQELQLALRTGAGETWGVLALYRSSRAVQQHMKHVFEKTGVRSRRDLVGQVFFAHYEPRLRDNEARAAAGRPLRPGPAPGAPAGSTV